MKFCVRCGAARSAAEAFCTSCGQPFPASPVTAGSAKGSGRWSSGRWPTHFVAAWVALGLVVAGTTVGVLVSRAENAPPTGQSGDVHAFPTSQPTDDGISPTPTDLFPTDTEPTDSTPTDDESSGDDESTDEPTETPTDPNGVVVLSESATLDPDAAPVLSVVSQYFQAINTDDFDLYYNLHTADAQAGIDAGTFETGFESTRDADAEVTEIGFQPDGERTAEVTFTSTQDAVDGPDGDTCDQWDIVLFLEADGDDFLIGSPPASYHASFQPC